MRAQWIEPLAADERRRPYFSFLGALTLSLPFWLMKGQPWKAQVVIVGGTLLLLTAIGYVASLL